MRLVGAAYGVGESLEDPRPGTGGTRPTEPPAEARAHRARAKVCCRKWHRCCRALESATTGVHAPQHLLSSIKLHSPPPTARTLPLVPPEPPGGRGARISLRAHAPLSAARARAASTRTHPGAAATSAAQRPSRRTNAAHGLRSSAHAAADVNPQRGQIARPGPSGKGTSRHAPRPTIKRNNNHRPERTSSAGDGGWGGGHAIRVALAPAFFNLSCEQMSHTAMSVGSLGGSILGHVYWRSIRGSLGRNPESEGRAARNC